MINTFVGHSHVSICHLLKSIAVAIILAVSGCARMAVDRLMDLMALSI